MISGQVGVWARQLVAQLGENASGFAARQVVDAMHRADAPAEQLWFEILSSCCDLLRCGSGDEVEGIRPMPRRVGIG
jgi:hypothetical protein